MPFLADVGSATFALVLALGVTIGLILWQTQRQWSRTYGRWRYREELEEPSFSSGVTAEELARWEVRMHELVRDLQGQLDTKIALVAELVAEAERASRKLEELLQQTGGFCRQSSGNLPPPAEARRLCPSIPTEENGLSPPASGLASPRGVSPGACQEEHELQRREHLYLQKNFSQGSARGLAGSLSEPKASATVGDGGPSGLAPSAPTAALQLSLSPGSQSACDDNGRASPREELPPARPPGKSWGKTASPEPPSRFAAVLRLHDLGLSEVEIARQTGLPAGEVELILRLHQFPHGGSSKVAQTRGNSSG